MGLISEEVEVGLNSKNIKYYESLGYNIPRRKDKWGQLKIPKGTKIIININDLQKGSSIKINIKCDGCGEIIKDIPYYNYNKYLREDGYYCYRCNKNNYNKWISFEQWCINNSKQDVLNRWDYDLNDCKPSEITFSTNKKYYFKCPRRLHKSELKHINNFISGQEGSMDCKACNSFAQWGIDNIDEDFLEKYWDYEENININPWVIQKSSAKPKIWIKCQEKNYHESYNISCMNFIRGKRCPYCVSKKIHPLDSLGKVLEDKNLLHLWSNKNNKSPYMYAPNSGLKVWWKCQEGIHKDYSRIISNSIKICDFRCPECQYSKGEKRIANYFINKGFIKISEDDYKILNDISKEKYNYYIPQKTFDELVGTGNGLLSYDFCLPNMRYNLLIEYQGEQHEKYIPGLHKSKKDFEKQLEHDRRKREYAKNNNINFLGIWYYDYDNIEIILDEHLK